MASRMLISGRWFHVADGNEHKSDLAAKRASHFARRVFGRQMRQRRA